MLPQIKNSGLNSGEKEPEPTKTEKTKQVKKNEAKRSKSKAAINQFNMTSNSRSNQPTINKWILRRNNNSYTLYM